MLQSIVVSTISSTKYQALSKSIAISLTEHLVEINPIPQFRHEIKESESTFESIHE
jgi:hypothetical protein